MTWKHMALVPVLMTLAACAQDGGSSGTGISTAEGNVVSVASARTGTQGIQVTIEGTDAKDQTDADGLFRVRGQFAGTVTLRFTRTDDGVTASLPITVPAGGHLTLTDVRLDAASHEATAGNAAVVFDGLIAAVDCSGQLLTLLSEADESRTHTYVLELDTSSLIDRDGNPVACATLVAGDRAHVEGAVGQAGTFYRATVMLQD
jgi:hypothetical protein